jgi:hypothetical protein
MQISFIYITLVLCWRLLVIYSLTGSEPSIISLESTSVVVVIVIGCVVAERVEAVIEVLLLLPAVVCILFVAPGFTLSKWSIYVGVTRLGSIVVVPVESAEVARVALLHLLLLLLL